MGKYPHFDDLVEVYRNSEHMCVFTGAGVSFTEDERYRAPEWKKLLFNTLKLLLSEKGEAEVQNIWEDLQARYPDHWDLATGIKGWAKNEQDYLAKLRTAVLRENESLEKYKRLKQGNLRKAHTLNAVIAFCSGVRYIRAHPCLGINPQIRAVVTTNYDFFLEAGATTKHQADRFKPIARTTAREEEGKLPVYHLHGYFPYYDVPPEAPLILDTDSYQKAYQPEGRVAEILKKFLGPTPTLFIGFSFEDKFLLDQLHKQRSPDVEHFALLRAGDDRPPDLLEKVVKAGVSPILYQEHYEVGELLFEVYASTLPGGVPVIHRRGGVEEEKLYSPEQYWSMLIDDKKWTAPGD